MSRCEIAAVWLSDKRMKAEEEGAEEEAPPAKPVSRWLM